MSNILPNTFFVGAQKSGTTSVYYTLIKSEEIYFPKAKELHYFDNPSIRSKGKKWLKNRYIEGGKFKIRADMTPDYLLYSHIADDIFNTVGGDVKIVIILRNPVDRAYSAYNFYRMLGVEEADNFEEAIEREDITISAETYIDWHTPPYYISRGLYFNQVKRYIDRFGKDNVHIAIFEDLFLNASPAPHWEKLFQFLDISPVIVDIKERSNETSYPVFGNLKNILRENTLKNLFKSVSPKKYITLRNKLNELLSRAPDGLSHDMCSEIYAKYFIEDVLKLKKLIKNDLEIWR